MYEFILLHTTAVFSLNQSQPPTLFLYSSNQGFATSSPPEAAFMRPSPKVICHNILTKILDFKSLREVASSNRGGRGGSHHTVYDGVTLVDLPRAKLCCS